LLAMTSAQSKSIVNAGAQSRASFAPTVLQPNTQCLHSPIPYIVREPFMPPSANIQDAPIAHKAEGPDPYAWLQERDTGPVLDYLKAENHYQEAQTADQAGLRESLFEEIKGRILETDLSLPSPWGPYLYYTRTTAGDEYARHYRCPRPADDSLQLDESQRTTAARPQRTGQGWLLFPGRVQHQPGPPAPGLQH